MSASNRCLVSALALAVIAPMAIGSPLAAQADDALNPGDVVRVNHDFVGTLMSIDDATTLTVLGEGERTCWAGISHGDAPRCDPAPAVRRVVDWGGATVERYVERSHTKHMLLGFIIGAAVGTPIGYVTGPGLGYGKIDGCVEVSPTALCTNPIWPEEYERRQRSQDQTRGAVFFGIVGATAGAILARRMVNEWIVVAPPMPADPSSGWKLGVNLPVGGR